jgi:hypothetical protein
MDGIRLQNADENRISRLRVSVNADLGIADSCVLTCKCPLAYHGQRCKPVLAYRECDR